MLRTGFEHIAKNLQGALVKELLKQDHKATGKLEDSVEVVVTRESDGWHIKGQYLYYGRFVDTGRKSGVKRVPISALIDWIRAKKLDLRGNKEKSVAFAIQNAIFKKGIPTNGDESKKRWVSRTLENSQDYIEEAVEKVVYGEVILFIKNMIEETNIELRKNQAA